MRPVYNMILEFSTIFMMIHVELKLAIVIIFEGVPY